MPDVTAEQVVFIPTAGGYTVSNRGRGVVLITTHNLEVAGEFVCHGVEAYHLVRHGDGEQMSGN